MRSCSLFVVGVKGVAVAPEDAAEGARSVVLETMLLSRGGKKLGTGDFLLPPESRKNKKPRGWTAAPIRGLARGGEMHT